MSSKNRHTPFWEYSIILSGRFSELVSRRLQPLDAHLGELRHVFGVPARLLFEQLGQLIEAALLGWFELENFSGFNEI